MAKRKDVYKSYLLRVWRDEENGRCRIRLEDVSAADQVSYFADMETTKKWGQISQVSQESSELAWHCRRT